MALPLLAILNTALGVAGIIGGGSTPTPGGNTASKVAQHQNTISLVNKNRSAKAFRERVLDDLEALDRGEFSQDQLELDLFGKSLAQQQVASLGRQEAGASEGITRRFGQRGLAGSGIEAEAQTQLSAQFGFEKSRVVNQQSFNRLQRKLEQLRLRESQLGSLAGAPISRLPVAQQQQPDQTGRIGGFLLQQGLQGLLTNALAPSTQAPPTLLQRPVQNTSVFGGGPPLRPDLLDPFVIQDINPSAPPIGVLRR